MPLDEITQKVSDRYARAASTGEQMCCPTSYDMANLQSFIPDEVLKISYGCGTPAGLKTVSPGETVLDIVSVISMPMTCPEGPTRREASKQSMPPPDPISSTVSPGETVLSPAGVPQPYEILRTSSGMKDWRLAMS